MRKEKTKIASAVLLTAMLVSCNAYKKLPYLQDAAGNQFHKETLATKPHEPKIMPNDILSITVNSNIEGADANFNIPVVPNNSDQVIQTMVQSISNNMVSGTLQNYIVDEDGEIEFPVLGNLKIAGMTRTEAQNYIASLIYPAYIVAEKPIVNVRFLNFQVSVLGEVLRPGTFTSTNGQMTVLDALAAAGDLTVWGKRDNVLLIRINEKGKTIFYRLDLQSKGFITNHETFYLQQNDKLYVETNKAKGNNAAYGTEQQLGLSAMSVGISAISLIMVIINTTTK